MTAISTRPESLESCGSEKRLIHHDPSGKRYRAVLDTEAYPSLSASLGATGIFCPLDELTDEARISLKRNRALYRLDEAVRPVQLDATDHNVILKHERFPFPTWLLTLPIAPIGLRERHNLRTLRSLGIPVVSAIAAGEVGWGPFFFETYVATIEIPDSYNLSEWVRNGSEPKRHYSAPEVVAALPKLAEIVATLHKRRFYCRTLFAKNVIMHRGEQGEIRFTLLDIPRARFYPRKKLSFRRAVFDLACLDKWASGWLSRSMRLRLLKHYVAALGEGPELRVWVRRIEQRRNVLMRRTFVSWLLHRARRRAKKLPGVGKWVR